MSLEFGDDFDSVGLLNGYMEDDFDFAVKQIKQNEQEDLEDLKNESLSREEKESRRKGRLERNREIARNCRKRKREKIEALVEEVTTLRERNRKLELKLKMCQNKLGEPTSGRGNRGKEEENKRLKDVYAMNKMLEQRYSNEEILKKLNIYTETYSDFGEEREKLVKVHINQLEQLLLPTQISKMALWILKQDDAFYESDEPDSIWNMLCSELQLDESQKKDFKEERKHLGEQNSSMKKCLVSLNKFEEEVNRNMELRKRQIGRVLKIISPTQIVKFLKWVEENQACVHMLNGLWTINKQRSQEIKEEMMKPLES